MHNITHWIRLRYVDYWQLLLRLVLIKQWAQRRLWQYLEVLCSLKARIGFPYPVGDTCVLIKLKARRVKCHCLLFLVPSNKFFAAGYLLQIRWSYGDPLMVSLVLLHYVGCLIHGLPEMARKRAYPTPMHHDAAMGISKLHHQRIKNSLRHWGALLEQLGCIVEL